MVSPLTSANERAPFSSIVGVVLNMESPVTSGVLKVGPVTPVSKEVKSIVSVSPYKTFTEWLTSSCEGLLALKVLVITNGVLLPVRVTVSVPSVPRLSFDTVKSVITTVSELNPLMSLKVTLFTSSAGFAESMAS